MGFESFRVELRGGSLTHLKADRTIREMPHVKPDCESLSMKGSSYYLFDDGRHLIEVELRSAPVRVSCRFTLCHPSSVDSVFLELMRELMQRLGMEAKICDDVRMEHNHWFSLDHYDEFSSVTSHYIAARRLEWRAAFGDEQLAATTNELYERIILPRCQPVVEHPA